MRNFIREKRLRTVLLSAGAFLAFFCFSGCGGSGASAESLTADSSYGGSAAQENESAPSLDSGHIYMDAVTEEGAVEVPAETAHASVASGRKLVRTTSLTVETEEFDTLVSTVEERVERLGGYIESMNLNSGSGIHDSSIRKKADMTLRIPKDRLNGFVSEVEKLSNVTSREESAEDVTLQYVDTESLKKALLTEQERLLAFLEQAENLEDVITLEQRLSEVRYQLESAESKLRTLDNLVDYATVTLNIEEVTVLTPTVELSDWERMTSGFADSVKAVAGGIKNFLIGLVIDLPYLIFWAVFVLLVFLLVRFFTKRSRKRREIRGKAGRPEKKTADSRYGVYGQGGYRNSFSAQAGGQGTEQSGTQTEEKGGSVPTENGKVEEQHWKNS